MKKKTAKKILHLMFELGAALDGSTALVLAEEPEDEFKKYRQTVAKLMADMQDRLITPICSDFPDLKPRQLYGPDEEIPRGTRTYRHKGIPPPLRARKAKR